MVLRELGDPSERAGLILPGAGARHLVWPPPLPAGPCAVWFGWEAASGRHGIRAPKACPPVEDGFAVLPGFVGRGARHPPARYHVEHHFSSSGLNTDASQKACNDLIV